MRTRSRTVRAAFALALVGGLAMAAVPAPAAAAQTYEWTFTCSATGPGHPGEADATWDWLKDGVAIEGGSGFTASSVDGCNVSVTAERPEGANGLTVTLNASVPYDSATKTVTKKFAADKGFTLSLSVTATVPKWACKITPWCHSLKASFSVAA